MFFIYSYKYQSFWLIFFLLLFIVFHIVANKKEHKMKQLRFYGLKHKSGIEYKPETGFSPMTHKEACTFKSKLMRPLDWELIEV